MTHTSENISNIHCDAVQTAGVIRAAIALYETAGGDPKDPVAKHASEGLLPVLDDALRRCEGVVASLDTPSSLRPKKREETSTMYSSKEPLSSVGILREIANLSKVGAAATDTALILDGMENGQCALWETVHKLARQAIDVAEEGNSDEGKPVASRDWRSEYQELEFKLCNAANLVDALQQICWQFSQETIEEGTELSRIRNSVIGLGDALEASLNIAA